MNPFKVVEDFERALCEYTGAPYCVTTTSCTMAILLASAYQLARVRAARVQIPKRTYVGVAYALREAGAEVIFRDQEWRGAYRIEPLGIWDSARRFRQAMYSHSANWAPGRNENSPALHKEMVCVSFHWQKTLGIQQGGAILHADKRADEWLRRARFDGRRAGVPPAKDTFPLRRAWHAYMAPETAAAGLVRLQHVDPKAPDIPWDDYPDLSKLEAFR